MYWSWALSGARLTSCDPPADITTHSFPVIIVADGFDGSSRASVSSEREVVVCSDYECFQGFGHYDSSGRVVFVVQTPEFFEENCVLVTDGSLKILGFVKFLLFLEIRYLPPFLILIGEKERGLRSFRYSHFRFSGEEDS